ncbi:CAP domain-containing protein, partial [Leucosporidium creatinivorum]
TTASSSSSTLSTFAQQAVDAHNAVRSTHHAPDVTWDDSLASYADDWAHGCDFEHSGGPHGENLFAVFPAQDQLTDPTDGIKSWASEESSYDYNNPGFSMDTGHFTQLVWVGTTKIGCSLVACDSAGMSILVCEYEEFGNMGGEYGKSALKRLRRWTTSSAPS